MRSTRQNFRAFLITFFMLNFLFWYIILSNLIYLNNLEFVSDFQKIGNGADKLYVYSAYFYKNTSSNDGHIKILAGLTTDYQKPLLCQFYSDDDEEILTTAVATLKKLSYDDNQRPYLPYYITCNVSGKRPTFVSVLEAAAIDRNETRTNLLRIIYKTGYEQKYNFALCVQPISNFDNPLRFAEFIEFYKLMGVEKFTFYNQSIGPKTSCLIKSYGDLIEILPWTCPYVAEKDIRYYGQFIAENECLHRYKSISKYLVIVDLDEFIMPSPSTGNNYTEMIEAINTKSIEFPLEEISGYIFHNAFYFSESETVDSKMIKKAQSVPVKNENPQFFAGLIYDHLQISKKILRSTLVERHGHRSKYIIFPDRVVEVACHVIAESNENTRPAFVPLNMAYSHHYRRCTLDLYNGLYPNWCKKREKMVENSAQRFAENISLRIAAHFNSKANHCHNTIRHNLFLANYNR